MGTRARWFSARWRFREIFEDGGYGRWNYTDLLSDAMTELEGLSGEIQKRTGRKDDYVYVFYRKAGD